MHEVGVATEVLKIVREKAQGRKIVAITVELADDGHTTPETLTHAFEHCAAATNAEGAKLTVIPGTNLESRVVDLEVEK